MPLPKSKKPGVIIKFLKKEKPGMKKKQRIAIALSQARKHGADMTPEHEALKQRMYKKMM